MPKNGSLKYYNSGAYPFRHQSFKDYSLVSLTKKIFLTDTKTSQRRRKDVVKTSLFWSQRRLRLVRNGSRDDLLLRRGQDDLQETYSRPP